MAAQIKLMDKKKKKKIVNQTTSLENRYLSEIANCTKHSLNFQRLH